MSAARRFAAAVAVAALVGAGGGQPTEAGAPEPRPSAELPALRLVDQPIVVAPDGDFGVLLEVVGRPDATEIAVDIYGRTASGDLPGVQPSDDPEATFEVVPLPPANPAGTRVTGFTINLSRPGEPKRDPRWGHAIAEPGVYPVRVRLRDPNGDIATFMTALTRLPDADQLVTDTQVAVLVDIGRPPPTEPQARAQGDTVDASLLDELRPILSALAERPDLAANISITPDTLARLAGGDDPDAADVLGQLRTEAGRPDRAVLDAPYVDLDVASLLAAGLGAELGEQLELGRSTLTQLLQPPLAGTWQLDHRIDEATLSALGLIGIDQVVLPGDAVTRAAGVTAPVTLDGSVAPVTALVDSEVFELGAAAPRDPVLAAHLLLARVAALDRSGPIDRAVLVEIDPATAESETLRIVLDALAFGTPFYRPATLDQALATPPGPAAPLANPRIAELGGYPAELLASRAALSSYASMVGDRIERIAPFERTLAISAASDLPLDQRIVDAQSVAAALAEPFAAISIPAADTVTLGARDARFPLPIRSEFDEPVQVVIELESSPRIEFPRDRIEETIQPGRGIVSIEVRTLTSGDTPVRVTVRTPDDGVILAEGRYSIRSTAVSGVGVILTVGAAAFLALWWGRHWLTNRRIRSE